LLAARERLLRLVESKPLIIRKIMTVEEQNVNDLLVQNSRTTVLRLRRVGSSNSCPGGTVNICKKLQLSITIHIEKRQN